MFTIKNLDLNEVYIFTLCTNALYDELFFRKLITFYFELHIKRVGVIGLIWTIIIFVEQPLV